MHEGLFKIPTPVNEAVLGFLPKSKERDALKNELSRLAREPAEIPLVIAGKRIWSKERYLHSSPHHHETKTASCSLADANHIQDAIQAALNAQKPWAALPWQERAAIFLRAADLLATKYRFAINAQTMHSQSKTAHQAEIDAACELIDFFRFNSHYLERILAEQPPVSPRGQWNRLEARPLEGFVAAIGPFNFTSISVNLATAPALMGCSVLWKPSLQALAASYVALECLEEAGLPPGVINLVPADGPLFGKLTLNHSDLAGIHFTGSTKTFNKLWKGVAENIERYRSYPRIVGETGGKDFVFAHASADPDALVAALVRGAFEYQGQKCSAASRAFIPAGLWAKIKDKLCDETRSIKVGDPSDYANFMGAVIDEAAFKRISGYIQRAADSSEAKLLAGGECDAKVGYFIRPTLIQAESPVYESMREEIFGPVLSIYVYDEARLDETLKLCDESTPYALTGAVFANDRLALAKMDAALRNTAGNFYINDKPTGAVVGQQPFGGARASGTNDKAGSLYNLLRWTNQRTIKENFLPIVDYRYPFMET